MTTIKIQNLKCHGCANTITKGLQSIEGISEVQIHIEDSTISFAADDETRINQVKKKLLKMGYPEEEAKNTTIHKAKSYVSCAIGRINE